MAGFSACGWGASLAAWQPFLPAGAGSGPGSVALLGAGTAGGILMDAGYKAETCAVLEAVGIDQRFWWIN